MKLKLALLCGLALAGANAMACYTVYDGSNRVIYQGTDAPVDMSLPLHQSVGQRYGRGASMVFNQSNTCTPVGIAQVARSNARDVPAGTIRMERTGRTIAPSSEAPLLTDRTTAQANHLPHTVVAGNIVMVPAAAAARVDLPTFTVIPADVAVARTAPSAVNTAAMGAGPASHGTVITEMRDPPMTITRNGNKVSVQR
ncbi:MAG: hypothetical protein JWP22_2374 [Ramlibacter sp.]|nr:hypothetical protein [Ramlibacter sp.]MDB5913699.1 hypothetical protein [Ramlibacter sp.]